MLKSCLNCDESFDGDELKFCSLECNETYKKILIKLDDILENDEENTYNLEDIY